MYTTFALAWKAKVYLMLPMPGKKNYARLLSPKMMRSHLLSWCPLLTSFYVSLYVHLCPGLQKKGVPYVGHCPKKKKTTPACAALTQDDEVPLVRHRRVLPLKAHVQQELNPLGVLRLVHVLLVPQPVDLREEQEEKEGPTSRTRERERGGGKHQQG